VSAVVAPKGSCAWGTTSELMLAYHDTEWGVPVHDDLKHFEFLVLDAFQAGLSWSLVLNKRENFRKAFAGFDPAKVVRFSPERLRRLLQDPGIVRNRQKIDCTVSNARAFLKVQAEHGSFDAYIWQFVDGATRVNRWRTMRQIPPRTRESDAMSTALKQLGFKFVGSTICYSYMQAAGLVNDHIVTCPRRLNLPGGRSRGRAAR
jgi:DNA-3-methyladenine glycosylase I